MGPVGGRDWGDDRMLNPKDLKLVFISHGLKSGKPLPKADIYLDCRGLWEDGTQGGASGPYQGELQIRCYDQLEAMETLIKSGFAMIERRRQPDDPLAKPYVICTLCAHGVTRSVGAKNILAGWFKALGFKVEVN